MRPRSTVTTTALVLALTAGVASAAPPLSLPTLPGAAPTAAAADLHVRRAAVSRNVARALGPAGEMRGVVLNDVGVTRSLDTAIADFPRLAAEGVTSVSIYLYLYVPSPTGSTVATGLQTPTDPELQLVTAAAQATGLAVHFQPVLLDTQTNSWRGRYRPADLDQFFASYTTAVLHYADLAQSLGVTLFYVGSENEAIAGETARWRQVVAQVRQHYRGALSYMTTGYASSVVKFWNVLDLVAISAYFSLGTDKAPSYQRMGAAWQQTHLPYLASLAKAYRKPIVLAEVGYRSQRGGFSRPADPDDKTALPAPAAQADAYRALLDAVAKAPGVYGVSWFRWGPATHPLDTSYSPAGKPAECVLAARWSRDANVRAVAALPVCDLGLLDQTLNRLGV
ncbi:MAG: hypothetical protein JWN87_3325 [Frankiales bacterium]|nr:hypothetical protein [Frankiales bacterium]